MSKNIYTKRWPKNPPHDQRWPQNAPRWFRNRYERKMRQEVRRMVHLEAEKIERWKKNANWDWW